MLSRRFSGSAMTDSTVMVKPDTYHAVIDALRDLVSLYAATPGHDPSFVKKGQSALRRAWREKHYYD